MVISRKHKIAYLFLMLKGGHVYIMSSPNRSTIYVGVTSKLLQRAWEHRTKYYPDSFTAKYNCVILVYFQYYESIETAIAVEKKLKKTARKYKDKLIEIDNKFWEDLWPHIQP